MLQAISDRSVLREISHQVEVPGVGQMIRVVRYDALGEIIAVHYEWPHQPDARQLCSAPAPLFVTLCGLSLA